MKHDIITEAEEQILIGEGSIKNKKAKITEKNTPYIFSLLSKIYSNKTGSIVREVTSNCFDAHVKLAKQIEAQAEKILLANGDLEEVDRLLILADEKRNQPVFVRHFRDEDEQDYIEFVDNGTGISIELMDDVFMSYGESDKRDSDEFIGAFGLGSKSPFSYSDHFFVITKSEGIKYTYLLYETAAGPEYDILTEEPTDEHSGTTIRVPFPLEDYGQWERELKSQLRYFRNVFIIGFEGVSNEYIIHDYKSFQLRDDILRKNPTAPLHIVIGDVYYPLDPTLLPENYRKTHGINVALKFKIGDLKVTPNREAIEYNEKSVDAIVKKLDEFYIEIKQMILNKNHFISKSIIDYRKDIKALETGEIIVTSLIPGEEIKFNLNTLNLFPKKYVKYSFELGEFQVYIELSNLSPYNFVTPILMEGDYSNDHKLTQYKSSYRKPINEVYVKNGSGKYVVIPKDKVKLKNSERAYLNEEVTTSRVLKFNERDFHKQVITNIKIFDKGNDTELKYKDLTIAQLKKFIASYKKEWYETVFNLNFVRIEDLNIPLDYGVVKRPSISLSDGSILSYTLQYGGGFTRQEWPAKATFDSFKDGKNKGHIILYGEEKDRSELYTFDRSLFKEFAISSYRYDSGKFINTFYCSKKYFKILEQIPGAYNIKDIIEQKEKSEFFNHRKIKPFLIKNLSKYIKYKMLEKVKPYIERRKIKGFSQNDILTKEVLPSKGSQLFSKVLESKKWSETNISDFETNISFDNSIKYFFTDEYLLNFRKKVESRFADELILNRIWRDFVNDFRLELEYFFIYHRHSDNDWKIERLPQLIEILELKEHKTKTYLKKLK